MLIYSSWNAEGKFSCLAESHLFCAHLTLPITPMVCTCHLGLTRTRGCLQAQMKVNGVWHQHKRAPVNSSTMNPLAVCFPACLIPHDKMWQENFHLWKHYVLISLFFLALLGACILSWHNLIWRPQACALRCSQNPVFRLSPAGYWDFPRLIPPHI